MVFNFKNHTFLLKGSQLSLSGTQAPVKVYIRFGFGPFEGMAWAHDTAGHDTINGKRKIPLQFLNGYQDVLDVENHLLIVNKFKTSSDMLRIKGNIAFADPETDLSIHPLEIHFGDFTLTVQPENITKIRHRYIINQPSKTDRVFGVIDTNAARFVIRISRVSIPEQGGKENPVLLALRWGELRLENTIDDLRVVRNAPPNSVRRK